MLRMIICHVSEKEEARRIAGNINRHPAFTGAGRYVGVTAEVVTGEQEEGSDLRYRVQVNVPLVHTTEGFTKDVVQMEQFLFSKGFWDVPAIPGWDAVVS